MSYIPKPGQDYLLEIAKGNVAGNTLLPIVSTSALIHSTYTDIWDIGGIQEYPTSAESLEIVSDNANDTVLGTGAQIIVIDGLDANYEPQIRVVLTNGTTPVPVPGDWIRTRIIFIGQGGSNKSNVGTIDLRLSGDGPKRQRIRPTQGQSFSSHLTAPLGTRIFALSVTAWTPKNEDVKIRAVSNLEDGTEFKDGEVTIYQGTSLLKIIAPLAFPEKLDVKLQAKSENENVLVTLSIDYLIEDLT